MIKSIPKPTVGQLLKDYYPFFVHIYQRAYAWDTEQIEDFIKDIHKLYDAINKKPDSIHFFGGILGVHHHVDNRTGRKHEIVDGQQRIATFSITISLIIEKLESLAKKSSNAEIQKKAKLRAKQINEDCLTYEEIEGSEEIEKSKITLSKADNNFYIELINHGSPKIERASHKRLQKAKDKIKKELITPLLKGLKGDEKLDAILKLKNCLLKNCQLIFIVTEDKKKAYELFSVLNDRGESLSDGDLLRSHTLELLEKHGTLQSKVEDYWNSILAGDPGYINDFLRTYYSSIIGEKPPSRNLFDAYKGIHPTNYILDLKFCGYNSRISLYLVLMIFSRT